MNMLVQQYQSHVLGPSEGVDYASIIKQCYPPDVVGRDTLIGFKVRLRDTRANTMTPPDRLRYLDSNLGILRGKGCVIRESEPNIPNGFYLMTFPVISSQLATSLNNMFDVIASLAQYFGIVIDGMFEISVSGRCPVAMVETCFSKLTIPAKYRARIIMSTNILCPMGVIQRINNDYMCFRTRWSFNPTAPNEQHFDDLLILSQLISSMYNI